MKEKEPKAKEHIYRVKLEDEQVMRLAKIEKEYHIPISNLINYSIGKFCEAVEKRKLEREEHQEDNELDSDPEDLSTYLESYQNDPYGEGY